MRTYSTDASINRPVMYVWLPRRGSAQVLACVEGEVIGINVMIIQPGQGIGFRDPINLA